MAGFPAAFLVHGRHRFAADIIGAFKSTGTKTAGWQSARFTHDIDQYIGAVRR